MAQNTVFEQIIKLIPRTIFQKIVTRHSADKGLRKLDSWTWFGSLLMGQLSGHDSIRAIERAFAHNDKRMQRLGFGIVRKSTLADANGSRSLEVLEDVFEYCLAKANAQSPKSKFKFAGDVFAMDSTTIELCLSLCPWASFHHDKGACKLHTAIDVAGDIPQFAVITSGRVHDVTVAREVAMGFRAGDTVILDRGYMDYVFLNDLNSNGVFFVTRAKSNCHFKVVESRSVNRTQGFRADQTIYLSSYRGSCYKGTLRRISFREPDTGKWLVFLTNNFKLAVKTIAELYKARWKVELFFKTLKQNLKIKKFIGTNENAVKAQVLTALIAYLLLQFLRFSLKTEISIPDTMATIGVMLFMKVSISKLLGDMPKTHRHPPHNQLHFSFM